VPPARPVLASSREGDEQAKQAQRTASLRSIPKPSRKFTPCVALAHCKPVSKKPGMLKQVA
jgi:hypothetical protein